MHYLFKGYKDALLDAGLDFKEDLVIINDLECCVRCRHCHTNVGLNPIPDAAFVTNDLTAAVFA
ncbi:MAG: hypothetical protein IPL08_02695 [Saprospiraceae bacterium]|nr:hypothetical protein [Saprospiraceae bacterium]